MLLLSALCFLGARARLSIEPRYHVLLIGVSRPNCPGFPPLDAVPIDLSSLALVLETNWQVPKEAVTIVTDPKETTKEGIKKLIQSKLIEPCKDANDVVYFGYSGHGFQVVDLSKPTKLSQAIVPSDARMAAQDELDKGIKMGEIEPDSVLTGPEIGSLFDPLKGKTDNVTLTFDCCHSGQITRGTFTARGPTSNPALDRYLARGAPQTPDPLTKEVGRGRGLVCLSAAAPEQFAWETGEGGVFTRALVAALRAPIAPGQKRSYDSLFKQLRAEMLSESPPSEQDPEEEGDTSRTILGGDYVASRTEMEISVTSDNQLRMGAGLVHGIKQGFLIGLLPAGTTDPTIKPTWTATVGAVRTGDCDLNLSADSNKLLNGHYDALQGAIGVLLDGQPDGAIRVNVSDLPGDVNAALKADLEHVPMVDLTAPANDFDYRIESAKTAGEPDPNRWDLVDGPGKLADGLTLTGTVGRDAALLAEELQSLARRNAVMALNPTDLPDTTVDMRLVPVEIGADGKTVTSLQPDSALQPGVDASSKLKFAVQVRLHSATGSPTKFLPYLALLNVNPHPTGGEKRVVQLWPAADSTGVVTSDDQFRRIALVDGWRYLGRNNDIVLGDKPESVAAWNVDAQTDGLGLELFKLFATDQPEEYGPLLDPALAGTRGIESSLARTLGNFAKGQPRSRAAQATNGPSTEHWCTASILLNVVATG